MTRPSASASPELNERPLGDRLDSWKEIAGYLRRDVTTVQRWERREGMPVHRHVHDKQASVYAFRSDLDAWARSRLERPTADDPAPLRRYLQATSLGPVPSSMRMVAGWAAS